MNDTTTASAPRWMEKASDFANAILVKETRQALKSRQFIITFLLLLAGAWLVSMFFILSNIQVIQYASKGGDFFLSFYFVLLVAVYVIVPFGAFRSLLAEREQNTFEALAITTLTPRQIVWGKLLSAVLQTFLYYSAITPFIAFASLLQGFDVGQAAFLLVLALFVSTGCAMAGLMLATLTVQRHLQVMLSVALLGGLVFLLFSYYSAFYGFTAFMAMGGGAVGGSEFWWAVFFAFVVWCTYFALFQQIATAQLTFESDNRSTGIRVVCAVQFWLLWACIAGYAWFQGSTIRSEAVMFFASVSAIHWSLVGLFAATERERLSRRVRVRLFRNPLLRLLAAPLLPGGSRGFLYVLLHLGALLLIVAGMPWLVMTAAYTGTYDHAVTYTLVAVLYAVIFLGTASALQRWGGRVFPLLRTAHVRVMMIILLMGGVLLPYFVQILMSWNPWEYALIELTNPFETLAEVADGGMMSGVIVLCLLAAAAIVLVANLRALLGGLKEVLDPPPRPAAPSSSVATEVESAPGIHQTEFSTAGPFQADAVGIRASTAEQPEG